ncbi:MAG: tetratricopeptide repeat protein [Anaerolineae bacterium]|nr:tetratricopeptide repeat protein [Anaerolineae bacterium]
MTFQGIQVGRVVQAVFMVFLVSLGLSLLTSCLIMPFVSAEMMDRLSDLLAAFNTSGPDQEQQLEQFQNDVSTFAQDFEGELTIYYAVQWTLVAAVTYVVAGRMARRAAAPAQAAGYGLLIGVGVLVSYGAFCVAMTIAPGGIKLLYLMLLVMAGYFGGRSAGGRLLPADAAVPDQSKPKRPFFAPSQPGVRPEVYYNMGVQAALGGRRDEARQHFTRAVQGNPRYVEAWLQLANLADTPEQAWNYVQQARAISPDDPAVRQAVSVIWPQVAASAGQISPARAQPPYPGGAQDDVSIPRSALPAGIYEDNLPLPPGEEGDGAQPPESPGERAPDEGPRSPAP